MRLGLCPTIICLSFLFLLIFFNRNALKYEIDGIDLLTENISYIKFAPNLEELSYLSNLGGRDVLSLFDQGLTEKFLRNCPFNPVNNHHLVYLSLATSDYLENMKICLQSAMNHGLSKNELIILSLDSDVYEYFKDNDFQTIFLDYVTVLPKTWFDVGRLKQAIQYYFNCFGVDTLFFESDMIFCRNFKNELIETLNDGIDIQIMEDVHRPRKNVDLSLKYYSFNIGLMLVKSCNNTRKLFRRWLHDCYFTKDNLWDQQMFIFIVTNNGVVYDRNLTKQYLYYNFNLKGDKFNLIFHLLNPVKYVNYCSLILNEANRFNSSRIDKVLNYAREMNLTCPNLLHFACINGKNKFTYMKNISLNEDSYEYHLNYLRKFHFVV